jgi:signal transduction histidine kinase
MTTNATTQTLSLAEQFRAEQAAAAVPNVLKTLKVLKKGSKAVMGLGMLITFTHGASFLIELGAHWAFAGGIVLFFDVMIFLCAKILTTPAMSKGTMKAAAWVGAPFALVSMTNIFLAPGPFFLRMIFALIVLGIVAVEVLSATIAPDFDALEGISAQIAPAPVVVVDEEREARLAKRRAADKAKRAAAREAAKAAAEAAAKAEAEAAKPKATRKAATAPKAPRTRKAAAAKDPVVAQVEDLVRDLINA